MKIVDVIEKILQVHKIKNEIVHKILEGVVPWILQFFHESANIFLLRSKMLVLPLQRYRYVGNVNNAINVLELKVYQVVSKTRLTRSRNLSLGIAVPIVN